MHPPMKSFASCGAFAWKNGQEEKMKREKLLTVKNLVIIAVLIVNQFAMTIRISQMDSKVRKLAQRVALNEEKIEREKDL